MENRSTEDGSLDIIYGCLSNQRRRHTLHCLHDSGEPTAVSDLAADVAACETDRQPAAIPDETVEDVHVSLHHVHVPKLVESDLVRYVGDRTVVELVNFPTEFREEPDPLLVE